MLFPVAIEPGDDAHAYGVVFPDLPGCFSAGDSLEEALANAQEAASLWLETALDEGKNIPQASGLDKISANPEFAGWIFAAVRIDW